MVSKLPDKGVLLNCRSRSDVQRSDGHHACATRGGWPRCETGLGTGAAGRHARASSHMRLDSGPMGARHGVIARVVRTRTGSGRHGRRGGYGDVVAGRLMAEEAVKG